MEKSKSLRKGRPRGIKGAEKAICTRLHRLQCEGHGELLSSDGLSMGRATAASCNKIRIC